MRIVEAGLQKMGYKNVTPSDVERLVAAGQQKITSIRNHAEAIDAAVKAVGADHDREMLHREIMNKALREFVYMPKEDMLVLFCTFLTQLTIKEIV